ncbi:putative carboxylesterase [Xylaria bambusicola]|uniref:putative carboxylesterase n=1 Tax=Xylaria bambusicola TaxID=326684 RepID=UPI002007262E|nr:putative carboxylesterase [Xylaria bambusicola]KAI0515467.1 putative carboxylesterase [Xylaria bambusicola]
MRSLLAALRYLRLRILIGLIRLIVRFATPRLQPKPDRVLRVPSRDVGRTIRAHLYSSSPVEPTEVIDYVPRHVLINCCGSGFALPSFGADDLFCREISRRTGHVVLDLEYRLGPENPFPAAIHDVEDVVRYVLSYPGKYDAAHISISGFSSGGTLALVAPMLFPAHTFRNVVAFYPSVSMANDPGERRAPVKGPDKGRAPLFWTRLFREGYFGGMDPRDPRISPLYAKKINLPRNVLIFTAEYDVSALEAEQFAKKAEEEARFSNSRIELRRMRECGHGFDKTKRNVAARIEAYNAVVELLNHSLSN